MFFPVVDHEEVARANPDRFVVEVLDGTALAHVGELQKIMAVVGGIVIVREADGNRLVGADPVSRQGCLFQNAIPLLVEFFSILPHRVREVKAAGKIYVKYGKPFDKCALSWYNTNGRKQKRRRIYGKY